MMMTTMVCVCVFRDFAYVSVDASRGGSYTCHVFRSDTAACQISDRLHSVTRRSLPVRDDVTGSGRCPAAAPDSQLTSGQSPVTAALRPNSLPNLVTGLRHEHAACYDTTGIAMRACRVSYSQIPLH